MEKKKLINYIELAIAVILTLTVSMVIYDYVKRRIIFVPALLVIAGFIFAFFFKNAFNQVKHYLLKFRWLIALCVFIICVAFHIHGSSIAIYNNSFPTQTDKKEAAYYYILGKERQIRSDEWAVHTPTYFSQYYNDFKMKSSKMSVSGTNMVLDYYAPVKDITVIGKPFSWGYILFGNEVGLSWYWCGLMIMMFMSAFEMFMIITKKNVRLSVVGMLMIGLSPVMQWWFVPHITIVFVYAMCLFDIGYHFFTARSIWFKWLTTILAIAAVIGFALSIFPSCQLISALVVIALLTGCLIRDREDITFTVSEWYRIGAAVLVAGGILGYYVVKYWSDIQMILNTVYPGKRVSVGGEDRLYDLFTNLTSIFLPYKDTGNNSETASYIHFAPVFILLFPRINSYLKDKDDENRWIGKILFVTLLVQIVFMCAGFSETLSKITMFKYVNRMNLSYGFTAVIFTVWSFYVIRKNKGMFKRWEVIVYPFVYGIIYCTFIDKSLTEYISLKYVLAEILFLVVILILAMRRMSRLMSYLMAAVMCVAGLMVNPLCRGTAPITNHPISKFIQDTAEKEPDAQWMTADAPFFIGNFVMANGAKVIGATNFYPDNARWKVLDPDGEFEESYNRYSNQSLKVVDDKESSVDLLNADYININITPDDIMDLDVKYIVSPTDLHDILNDNGIDDDIVFEQDGYRVYRLSY